MSRIAKRHNPYGLTRQQLAFCDELQANPSMSITQAYKRHYKVKNDKSAAAGASKMMKNPKVKIYMAERREKREQELAMKEEEWWRNQREVLELSLGKQSFVSMEEIYDEDTKTKKIIELEQRILNLTAANKALEQIARVNGWIKDGINLKLKKVTKQQIMFVPAPMDD